MGSWSKETNVLHAQVIDASVVLIFNFAKFVKMDLPWLLIVKIVHVVSMKFKWMADVSVLIRH